MDSSRRLGAAANLAKRNSTLARYSKPADPRSLAANRFPCTMNYMGAHTFDHDFRVVLDCIRRIVHVLRLFDREAEKRVGLSGQVLCWKNFSDGGGASINELADRTHTHQSSVSVVVHKLVAANWSPVPFGERRPPR